AKALDAELPHTGEHLRHGRVSEWRATIFARETACLGPADRRAVDAALAADLPTLSDRQVESRAKALAVRFDAASVVTRAAKARVDRRVSLRPAPDTMTYLTALLPVEQGVAVYAALHAAVGAARATGDGAAPDQRGAGQVMADTLVERVTGQATAAAVPLEVQLVLPAETLLGGGDEPATLPGGHPVPAAFARRLLADSADACDHAGDDAGAALTLRRLFTTPDGHQLVAMDSRRRVFDGQLRRFLTLRDQSCRTPWCDAPIRHADHVVPDR
ncbi:HNH endonuclease, partial [Knoellia sp. p5-6-4]|nr:HNH endonuclease [Knoellia sp. p5-6-4]